MTGILTKYRNTKAILMLIGLIFPFLAGSTVAAVKKNTQKVPLVANHAPNWPLDILQRKGLPAEKNLFTRVHEWIQKQRSAAQLRDPYQKPVSRRLSLFNPGRNIIIALVGSSLSRERSSFGHHASSEIRLNKAFIKKLLREFQFLTQSNDWHFVLTDDANNVLQFLASTNDDIATWPGYTTMASSRSEAGYINLNDEKLKPADKICGLTSLYQSNPVVLRLANIPEDETQRVGIPTKLINILKKLPPRIKEGLVFSTAETITVEKNKELKYHQERVLLPFTAISTHEKFTVKGDDSNSSSIYITTSWPASELTADAALRNPPESDDLHKIMASEAPLKGRRLDLVIGKKTGTGESSNESGLFHRVANFPVPDSPEWDTSEVSRLEIEVSVKDILLLYTNPSMRHQVLYIREIIEEETEQGLIARTHLYPLVRESGHDRTIASLINEAFEKSKISFYMNDALMLHTSPATLNTRITFFVNAHDLIPSNKTLLTPEQKKGVYPDLHRREKQRQKSIEVSQVVDNANTTVLIENSYNQRDKDRAMAEMFATRQLTEHELIAGKQLSREQLKNHGHFYPMTGKPEKSKNSKNKDDNAEKSRFRITPKGSEDRATNMAQLRQKDTDQIMKDTLRLWQDEYRQQQRANRGSSRGQQRSVSSTQQPLGAGTDGVGNFGATSMIWQSLNWVKNGMINHPLDTVASVAAGIVAVNIYRQWHRLPGAREVLIKKAQASLPSDSPFMQEALETLINGTPDHLLPLWGADTVASWVHQASENWCQRHLCNAHHLPEIFAHYVLAPVFADKEKFLEEIRVRLSGKPIDSSSPWAMAVNLRREGYPAAVDLEPVGNTSWLVELDEQGIVSRAHNQQQLQQKPVKILRHSFLEDKNTKPMHERFARIAGNQSFIDVTGQYRRITTYPPDSQRYGVYVCSTIDGTNWRAIDFTGAPPATLGTPAILGYAHKAENGWCLVSSMDKWLTILMENGDTDILHPIESRYPVRLNLSQMMTASPDQLNSQQCRLQFWEDRQWHDVEVRDTNRHGEVEANLPANALYRARCHTETATFTLGHHFKTLELWSWPEALNNAAFKSSPDHTQPKPPQG